MVGTLKVWLYAASKAWLEMQSDKGWQALKGAGSYRLTVLANAPIQQWWPVTVCDYATRPMIRKHPQILE